MASTYPDLLLAKCAQLDWTACRPGLWSRRGRVTHRGSRPSPPQTSGRTPTAAVCPGPWRRRPSRRPPVGGEGDPLSVLWDSEADFVREDIFFNSSAVDFVWKEICRKGGFYNSPHRKRFCNTSVGLWRQVSFEKRYVEMEEDSVIIFLDSEDRYRLGRAMTNLMILSACEKRTKRIVIFHFCF